MSLGSPRPHHVAIVAAPSPGQIKCYHNGCPYCILVDDLRKGYSSMPDQDRVACWAHQYSSKVIGSSRAGSDWFRLVPIGSDWFRLVPIGSDWLRWGEMG